MARGPNVLVAGAGALGLSAALTLAERGARVTVDDPAGPDDNASGVAAGMLAPVFEAALDPVASPHFDLLMAARDVWPAFAARIGVKLDRSGAVAVGEAAWLAEVEAKVSGLGAPLRRLDGAALRTAAPGLAPQFQTALACAEDWRLSPTAALAALRRAAHDRGVTFRRRVVSDAQGFDRVLVATGAGQGLSDLAPEVAGLSPIKGHILRLPAPRPTTIRGPDVYIVPIAEGVAVGATMEPGRADRNVDPVQARSLFDAATRLFPRLAAASATAMVGVRAATPDGLPLAGASATPGVFVAAGARRNGWLLAPLIAQVACAHVMGGDPGPFAERLDPRRFTLD